MTTATEQAKGLAALDVAKEQLAAARKERAKLDEDARAFFRELAEAEEELRALAGKESQQFGLDGLPKKGTKAAELKAKLERAKDNRWTEILQGSDGRIRTVENEVRRLTADASVELATESYRRGESALERVKKAAREMREALTDVRAEEPVLLEITASIPRGAIDGRAVGVDERLGDLERALDSAEELEPARVPVLTPFSDEERRVLLTRHGWVRAGHAHPNDMVEQPPLLERGV